MDNDNKERSADFKARFIEKFLADGGSLEGMTERELIRFLIASCGADKLWEKDESGRLERRYGNMLSLLFAPPSELCGEFNIDKNAVRRLKLIRSMFIAKELDKLKLPIRADDDEKIRRYLSVLYIPHTVETVYVIPIVGKYLGQPCQISSGSEMCVGVSPKMISWVLEKVDGCKEFILAHNHPLAASKPSEDDVTFTTKLFGYLFHYDLTLKTHYIVGRDGVSTVPFDNNPMNYYLSL